MDGGWRSTVVTTIVCVVNAVGCAPEPVGPPAALTTFNPPRIQILREPRLRTPPAALVLAAPLGTNVEIVPRMGHADDVVAVDVRRDAALCVSGSRDGTVKVWDLDSGALLRTIVEVGVVTQVKILGDGRRVLTAGVDGTVRIWALPTGQRLRTITIAAGAPITALAVAANGAHAVAAYGAGAHALATFDLATGKRGEEVATSARISALAFTQGDDALVSGDDSGALKRYDPKTLELRRTIPGHAREILALATSGDGRRVLSASADGRLKLWDVTSGALLSVVPAHARPVRGVAVSRDARRAVSASEDGTVKVWDLEHKRASKVMVGHVGAVTSLGVSVGIDGVVSGGADGSVRLWDLSVGEAQVTLPARRDAVVHASVSQSGRTALAVSATGEMRLWDLSSLGVARQWAGGEGITAATLSADAAQAMTATTESRGTVALELWDISAGRTVHRFESHAGQVNAVGFSRHGMRALSGSMLGGLHLWGTAIRRPLRQLVGHSSPIRAISFADDGRRALVSAVAPMVGPDRVKLWDLDTGAELYSVDGYAVGALGADGKRAVLASKRGMLAEVDLDTTEVERSWLGHEFAIQALATDGRMRLIASGDARGVIKVWDNVRNRLVRTLVGHQGGVRTLALSDDAKRLISTGDDGTLRMWRLDNGASVSLVARDDDWLVYSSDGYFAASPRGGELAYAVSGARGFRLDQLAALHNRPDLLLERMGVGSAELIADLTARHTRRLEGLGITQQQLAQSYGDAPRVAITQLEQQGRTLTIGFEIPSHPVAVRYQVLVNGVPSLARPKRVTKTRLVEEVLLSVGRNRVEVDVFDAAGARAIAASHVVRFDPPDAVERDTRGVLHFVGVGISRHQEPALDNKYAGRDAMAVAGALRGAHGRYRDVVVHTLVDEEATRDKVLGIADKLRAAAVDDTVVVFVAGQWAHSRGLPADLMLLPQDGKSDALDDSAVGWSEVVNLLSGIRPRRRLLIVDGCVSGDRDDGSLRIALSEAARRGLRPRTSPALHLSHAVAPRTYLFFGDRMLKGTAPGQSGVVLLRASRASELCYEADDTQRGALTSAVLRALTSPDADDDGDGWVSMDELNAFVVPFVANMTGGLQHPVMIRDGVLEEIRLPRIEEVPAAAAVIEHPKRNPTGCACRVGRASSRTSLELWGLAAFLVALRRRMSA